MGSEEITGIPSHTEDSVRSNIHALNSFEMSYCSKGTAHAWAPCVSWLLKESDNVTLGVHVNQLGDCGAFLRDSRRIVRRDCHPSTAMLSQTAKQRRRKPAYTKFSEAYCGARPVCKDVISTALLILNV